MGGVGGFEKSYVTGDTPWDTGVPSVELIRLLEAGRLPGTTVLEFGCGTGTNAIEFARRGYEVTAIDFAGTAIQQAREKARRAGVTVDFRIGDLTRVGLGGPYDVLFDRGIYHGIRHTDLNGFLRTLECVSRPGTRWLCLAGNAKEPTDGPPVVYEHEFRTELGPLFTFLEIREFRFTLSQPGFRPLAWSILMERR